MENALIHDRGSGPEIIGTRITVYDLLHHFLDPSETEEYICGLYELTASQVAAARAYIFNHVDEVLAEYLKIEARTAIGNPPEVLVRAKEAKATLLSFKEWLARRQESMSRQPATSAMEQNGEKAFPSFKEWMAERQPASKAGS